MAATNSCPVRGRCSPGWCTVSLSCVLLVIPPCGLCWWVLVHSVSLSCVLLLIPQCCLCWWGLVRVQEYDITPEDQFLVLASDGLWDVVKDQVSCLLLWVPVHLCLHSGPSRQVVQGL